MPNQIILPTSPEWGYDGWPNEATVDAAAREATYRGEDAIGADVPLLDAGLRAYGSYVDNFGGWTELQMRFGKAVIRGVPGVYTNAANMQAVIDVMGSRDFTRFSAHFGSGRHVCGPDTCGFPQADITQWADKGPAGQNVDQWVFHKIPAGWAHHTPYLVSFTIFGGGAQFADVEPGAMQVSDLPAWYDNVAWHEAAKPAKADHHYGWYDQNSIAYHGGKIYEYKVVEEYDKGDRTPKMRAKLLFLARRIASIEHREHPNISVADALAKAPDHRGWRYGELMRRYHGKKGH